MVAALFGEWNKVALGCILAAGCASTTSGPDQQADAGDQVTPGADAAPQQTSAAVFAHSATDLYRIDPDTLAVQMVDAFTFDGTAEHLTDIALDRAGNMVGISLDNVYAIDPETAQTTFLAPLADGFTSLSFVPTDPQNVNSPERLIAATFDGQVFEINPDTGESTLIGDYGDDRGDAIGSSGDIVSVHGFGTVATVDIEGSDTDYLAWIDPVTFEATPIGDTGRDKIFGLGFWKGVIYGFTDTGEFLSIDPSNGVTSMIEAGPIAWWGSGVTTTAPTVD